MGKVLNDQNQKFSDCIRERRKKEFIRPFELAYKSFLDLSFDKKDSIYFIENASQVIEDLREECWENFLEAEDEFSRKIYRSLNDDEDYINLTNHDAVNKFIDKYTKDFYTLSLSNTQSRRTRAGAEFEAIIELLFIGADITLDSQGFLSSGIFNKHDIGKAVDLVFPGVLEYGITKRNCSLISCKTTLRERWAEVIEEKNRTGASEIYLATLDEKISKKTLETLKSSNVFPVVTKKLKEQYYSKNHDVLTFEELLQIVIDKNKYWTYDVYAPEKLAERVELLDKQIERHISLNHTFIKNFYYRKKSDICCLPDE